ncbi:MAG: conjugal transfer protein TraI [Bacteroidetes bacterium]|nr:conjugal transfer protein TraI [Bacteroidota bacterium]
MKRLTKIVLLLLASIVVSNTTHAQIPIVGLVTAAVKKVIVAIDLKVQQLQNKTIALQDAEKALENKMALGNLNDISGWLSKEKQLYAGYYQELQKVKQIVYDYESVKNIIKQQGELVTEYKHAYALFSKDPNFSATELNYMAQVYSGILKASIDNLDEVLLAVDNLTTQMSDAERLELIHKASSGLQHNLNDLRQFNNNGIQLSLARAAERNNLQQVKQLYGIN